MGKTYPAVEIATGDVDLMLAIVDDFHPAAVEERPPSVRVFFFTIAARRQALAALVAANYPAVAVDVDDEDWARRSQENLHPIHVGRITVAPSPGDRRRDGGESLLVVIQPSMGFGTGHHATTRLCLEALQNVDVNNRVVLDVGTGSGVLAIAAARLGATYVVGIDNDPDAVQSASENLTLNAPVDGVELRIADLSADGLPASDVVTANLTGTLLVRQAQALTALVRPGGVLIVSGLLAEERTAVLAAFATARLLWERTEDGWVGLALAWSAVK